MRKNTTVQSKYTRDMNKYLKGTDHENYKYTNIVAIESIFFKTISFNITSGQGASICRRYFSMEHLFNISFAKCYFLKFQI